MGVPPALPGRQQKFDISGGRHRRAIDETPNREPPSTRTGVPSMDDYESLSHSKWECKYHVVFIPKCRRKTLYTELRRHLGDVFRKLAEQKESKIEEGHLLLDHVHMLISIPAEICGVAGDRVYQGKKCDTLGPRIRREEAELRRSALLGARVLCLHSGPRPRGDTGIHQEARRGGQTPGADEPVALSGYL